MADQKYPSWVGLIFVFNLIVGTGALTLPAVFSGSGWLLSTVILIFLALSSYITVTFVIETISCGNASIRVERVKDNKIDERQALAESSSEYSLNDEVTLNARSRYYSLNSKVELGQMAHLYYNKVGRVFFYLALCMYLFGDLAIYVTAISMTIVDLSCTHSQNHTAERNYSSKCWASSEVSKFTMYRIYVFLFALLVGPFSYFAVQKTKYLQMLTTFLRWTAFLIMIGIACDRLRTMERSSLGNPNIINMNRLPSLVGSSVYSFMCHHSVPGLISPFANKHHIFKQFAIDYGLICGFYLLLSLTGIFAFENIQQLYTLNFLLDIRDNSSTLKVVFSNFIGAFPVFTLSTSFPIIAITLQNNLKAMILNPEVEYGFAVRRLAFPTLAIVPPIIVSLCTHNLRILVAITGSYPGVIIQYVIPVTLVYCARKSCLRDIGDAGNKFCSPFRHNAWLICILVWASLCMIFVTVDFIIPDV